MKSLKTVAVQAVYGLSTEVMDGANHWSQIDRIERRFNIQGTADHFLSVWKQANEKYVKALVESRTTWDQRLWLK